MQHTTIRYWDGVQAVQSLQDFSGTPSEAMLQGLQANTAYRVQAVWMDDQTELAFSNIAGFRTLGAGTITLQLHNISRDNYSYRVQYLFSSTYTLSSATLSTNGQTFTGSVSGNVITFIVTGLTAGDSYLYQVTAEDIYQESATDTGTIVTTVINQVNIYYDSRTENSVTFDLAYLHDYQFVSASIEVWNSNQDPDTDHSIAYDIWYDGDTQVTATGLNYETTYKFRAEMIVEDGFGNQTTVYSSVVTATTADHDYSNDYFTITNKSAGNGTVYLAAASQTTTVEVSTDGGSSWTSKTSIANNRIDLARLSPQGKLLVRHSGAMKNHKFYVTFNISASGNLTSLTHNAPTSNVEMPSYAFTNLFSGCTFLTDTSKIYFGGFSKIGEYGCQAMFNGCTSLTSAPSLPATALSQSCYNSMFNGCTSLTSAPSLPATALSQYCYNHMFQGCTSLTTAPALPATELAESCYSDMFNGCTSLTTAPALPATELAVSCYANMFYGCTSLTTAPALPATELVSTCYSTMFRGCTSLTSAPSLPATELAIGCYEGMFNGCTSLTTAPALPATELVSTCYDNMFRDCTSLTSAPSLPATELAIGCYNSMFNGCTSLTSAPNLNHVISVSANSMFYTFSRCSNLREAYAPTVDFANAPRNAFNNWLNGVAASGTLYADSSIASTIPTDSVNGCPSGWSVSTN